MIEQEMTSQIVPEKKLSQMDRNLTVMEEAVEKGLKGVHLIPD